MAYVSLVPILKSARRRLVKLFETATLPSKRMERQTTPSIAGQTFTPQIAFSTKGKVPNRNKNNSSTKPNIFHSKYVCVGGRKTREERKICLKIRLFGFPQTLVYELAATAARKVVSPSTLIGPFEFERALATRPSTGGKSSVASHYRSPHLNQRLSFLQRKTYLNMSEVNHKILNVNIAVIGYC